jgi:hypothetical protein
VGRGQGTAENPQDRVPTERHAQTGGHPRTGFAACLAPEQGWWDVRAYEQERDKVIAQQRVIVLCT